MLTLYVIKSGGFRQVVLGVFLKLFELILIIYFWADL